MMKQRGTMKSMKTSLPSLGTDNSENNGSSAQDDDDITNIKVFIRLRPLEDGQEPSSNVFKLRERSLTISNPRRPRAESFTFEFNRVFSPIARQEELFEETIPQSTVPLLRKCLEGYNTCCFAYGQTGSGKTHTMFGTNEDTGIIPKSTQYIFDSLEERSGMVEYGVVVSFLEIYCDRIRDLGRAYHDQKERPHAGRTSETSQWYQHNNVRSSFSYTQPKSERSEYIEEDLSVHEDSSGNVYVKDLSIIPVSSSAQVLQILDAGFALRATHETKLNTVSSRSHTVFTIHVIQKDLFTNEVTTGMLNLVDLAGSERLSKSDSSGQRLQEAQSINSSLAALGKVVMTLYNSNDKSNVHIPYRDCKLTRILQNSLGGNSYTSVLATIHPREKDCEESLSTLQFAHRCKSVTTRPVVSILSTKVDKAEKIKELKNRKDKLQEELAKTQVVADMRIVKLIRDLGLEGQLMKDGTVVLESGQKIGITYADAQNSEYCKRCVQSLIKTAMSTQALALGEKGALITDEERQAGNLASDMFADHPGEPGTTVLPTENFRTSGVSNENANALAFNGETNRAAKAEKELRRVKEELKLVKEQRKNEQESSRAEVEHLRKQVILSREALQKVSRESFQNSEELRKEYENLKRHHKESIDNVMNHSNKLLRSRSETIQVLSEKDELLRQSKRSNRDDHDQEDFKSLKEKDMMNRLLAAKDMEKQCLEHKLQCCKNDARNQKSRLLGELVENESKDKATIASLQNELKSLFQYTHRLSDLLFSCVEGAFPMENRGSYYRINIPSHAIPKDPLSHSETNDQPFPHLQGLVRSIQREGIKLFSRRRVRSNSVVDSRPGSRSSSAGSYRKESRPSLSLFCTQESSGKEAELTIPEIPLISPSSKDQEKAKVEEYRRQLRKANRREVQLRVALDSQQRLCGSSTVGITRLKTSQPMTTKSPAPSTPLRSTKHHRRPHTASDVVQAAITEQGLN